MCSPIATDRRITCEYADSTEELIQVQSIWLSPWNESIWYPNLLFICIFICVRAWVCECIRGCQKDNASPGDLRLIRFVFMQSERQTNRNLSRCSQTREELCCFLPSDDSQVSMTCFTFWWNIRAKREKHDERAQRRQTMTWITQSKSGYDQRVRSREENEIRFHLAQLYCQQRIFSNIALNLQLFNKQFSFCLSSHHFLVLHHSVIESVRSCWDLPVYIDRWARWETWSSTQ